MIGQIYRIKFVDHAIRLTTLRRELCGEMFMFGVAVRGEGHAMPLRKFSSFISEHSVALASCELAHRWVRKRGFLTSEGNIFRRLEKLGDVAGGLRCLFTCKCLNEVDSKF